MKSKTMFALMFVILVAMMAYFATSLMFFPNFNSANVGSINQNITITNTEDNGTTTLTFGNGTNISGTVKINFTFRANGTHNQHIINISTYWDNTGNGSYRFKSSLFNTSSNQYGNSTTFWENNSFNTALLPDGVYNVTVFAINSTHAAASLGWNRTGSDRFVIENVTVDNTVPSVGNLSIDNATFANAAHINNFTHNSGNRTVNVSVSDLTTNVSRVYFEFNNATSSSSGSAFNITAIANGSGFNYTSRWSQNFSALRGGYHTLKVIAIDFAGSVNQSITLNFNVNTAPNVTPINYSLGYNISLTSGNQSFNISVTNSTHGSGAANVSSITLMFDNASGNDFNVTISPQGNLTRTNHGHFWWLSYNLSSLEDGYNTVLVFANDTKANLNKSINLSFRVDKTLPSVTVTCSPGSVTVGASVECTCTSTDGGSGLRNGPTFLGDNDGVESINTATVGSFSSSSCSATDFAGNKRTATGSYSVVASTASSGGGSGGSGGGSSSGVSGQFEKKTWTSIKAGETATVAVANGAIGVTSVSFDVAKTTYGAWAEVSKKDSLPSTVASFGSKTYRNLEIKKNSIALKDADLSNIKIKFKVEKAWLTTEGLTKNDVALFRYSDGKWGALPTTVGEDDGNYIHYEATTPGFSYFIIGEKAGAAVAVPSTGEEPSSPGAPSGKVPAAVGEEVPSAGSAEESPSPSAPAWPWVLLVVLIVVVVAVVLWLRSRRE